MAAPQKWYILISQNAVLYVSFLVTLWQGKHDILGQDEKDAVLPDIGVKMSPKCFQKLPKQYQAIAVFT